MRSVLLAAGDTFADAPAAGAPAALGGAPEDVGERPFPLLLTAPDELPAATSAALDDLPVDQVIVVGGEQAVSPQVAAALEERRLNVVRLAGATRVETAAAVADFTVDVLPATPAVVHLARGDVFADALAAGPLAADVGWPLLLTQGPDALGAGAEQWLATRCPAVTAVRAVGGTGRSVAFSRGPARDPGSELYVIGVDGTGLRQVTDEPAADVFFPAWSPDGTQLVHQSFPRSTAASQPRIAVVAADGSGQRVLAEQATQPAWSPDGTLVSFVTSSAPGSPGSSLRVVRPDGTGLRELAAQVGPMDPAWSPDSQRIAFGKQADELGTADLAVVGRGGSGDRVLADVRPIDGSPSWSPDGSTIVFTAAFPEGDFDLYAIGADGEGLRPLTSDGRTGDAKFAPSG